MNPCKRGCCWVPMAGICAQARTCACHWEERKPASRSDGGTNYRDPTAMQAVRNVMNEGRRR